MAMNVSVGPVKFDAGDRNKQNKNPFVGSSSHFLGSVL
jgi:hypothetical protein